MHADPLIATLRPWPGYGGRRQQVRTAREARVAQEVTRRRVLAVAAATLPLVAGGCKGVGALGTPPKAAADVAVTTDAIAVERDLIARYGAVAAAMPALAPTLRPLLAQHWGHLARLRARLIIPRAPAAPSPAPSRSARAQVPGTAPGALAYLCDAENAASTALLAHLRTAPASLAQLLASISASEATHAMILGGHGRDPASPSPAPKDAGPAAVRALQAALAAENSAVYGYGIAGAHLAGARRTAAVKDWVFHQTARDTLTAMLTARGGQPAAAAAGYELPFGVHSAPAAVALAALLEDRITAVYLGLVAPSDPGLRAFGAAAMRSAALRAASWRGSALAFPGLDVPAPSVPGQATGASGRATPASGPGTSPAPSHPG